MSRFVEIKYRSGNAVLTRIINIDTISDFSVEKKFLRCVAGSRENTYNLTDESSEQLKQVLFINNLSDPFQMVSQMQRDLDAYKTTFINVLGWCNGMFRAGKAIPAIGSFGDVSSDVNDQMNTMMSSLRLLNDEYLEMKKKLEDAGITPLDSHAVDPNNQ